MSLLCDMWWLLYWGLIGLLFVDTPGICPPGRVFFISFIRCFFLG